MKYFLILIQKSITKILTTVLVSKFRIKSVVDMQRAFVCVGKGLKTGCKISGTLHTTKYKPFKMYKL